MEVTTIKKAREAGLVRYYTGKLCKRGHDAERFVASHVCVECAAEHQKASYHADKQPFRDRNTNWRKTNPERKRHWDDLYYNTNRSQILEDGRFKYRRKLIDMLLLGARRRARLAGFDFSISEEDLPLPTHCPLLGIPIEVGIGRRHENSPTIDRINNDLGYTAGNVWIVSFKANRLKSNATLAELELLTQNLKARQRT